MFRVTGAERTERVHERGLKAAEPGSAPCGRLRRGFDGKQPRKNRNSPVPDGQTRQNAGPGETSARRKARQQGRTASDPPGPNAVAHDILTSRYRRNAPEPSRQIPRVVPFDGMPGVNAPHIPASANEGANFRSVSLADGNQPGIEDAPGEVHSGDARSDAHRIEKQRLAETPVVEKDPHRGPRLVAGRPEIEEDGVRRLRKSRNFHGPSGHQRTRPEGGSDERLERSRHSVRQVMQQGTREADCAPDLPDPLFEIRSVGRQRQESHGASTACPSGPAPCPGRKLRFSASMRY